MPEYPLWLNVRPIHQWPGQRAIALTLRAIRQTEQYGVGKVEQFYKGFAQLTAATPGPPTFTVDEAIAFLGATAELDRDFDPSLAISSTAQLYRRAVAVAHPDKPTGNRQMWDRVEAAADTLRTAGRL